MTYIEALNDFVKTIEDNSTNHYKEHNMTFMLDNPEVIKVNKGRRFDKVVSNSSNGGDMMTSSRSVHCFVEKETGHIFKPAGWNAPQLKTHTPVRGSIYEIDSYKNADPHGGWLYLR